MPGGFRGRDVGQSHLVVRQGGQILYVGPHGVGRLERRFLKGAAYRRLLKHNAVEGTARELFLNLGSEARGPPRRDKGQVHWLRLYPNPNQKKGLPRLIPFRWVASKGWVPERRGLSPAMRALLHSRKGGLQDFSIRLFENAGVERRSKPGSRKT